MRLVSNILMKILPLVLVHGCDSHLTLHTKTENPNSSTQPTDNNPADASTGDHNVASDASDNSGMIYTTLGKFEIASLPSHGTGEYDFQIFLKSSTFVSYQIKTGARSTTSCTDPTGYSDSYSIKEPYQFQIPVESTGDMVICLVGGDGNGGWQSFSEADQYVWLKLRSMTTLALVGPSQVVTGLKESNQQYEIVMSFSVVSGEPPAKFVSWEGIGPAVHFKGGQYPGSGGTCGESISQSCQIVLIYQPQATGIVNYPVKAIYNDGINDVPLNFNMSGSVGTVIGQPNSQINLSGRMTSSNAQGIYSDGQRLFLADSGNHRVMIWNSIPTVSQTPADFALGQPSIDTIGGGSAVCNRGIIDASTLCFPTGVANNGNKLIVADYSNNRVLIWNTMPTQSGQPADIVLGQMNMNSKVAGTGKSGLTGPWGVFSDGIHLWVTEPSNCRVLQWNAFPSISNTAADIVLGDPVSPCTALNAKSLQRPYQVHSDGTRLLIADPWSNRILMWSSIPTIDNQDANYALGQPDFTSNGYTIAQNTMPYPRNVVIKGGRLYVTADYSIRIFNTIPTSNMPFADVVMGQPDYMTMVAPPSKGRGLSKYTPSNLTFANNKMIIMDFADRPLIWNTTPTTDTPADVYLGQGNANDMVENSINEPLNGKSLGFPAAVKVYNGHVLVSDSYRSRLLLWSQEPQLPFESANIAIGQNDLLSDTRSASTFTKSGMGWVGDIEISNDGRLFAIDSDNYRVLMWNSLPTTSGAPADFVLGTTDATVAPTSSLATSPANQITTYSAYGISANNGRIFVSSYSKRRVMYWNSYPTTDGAQANYVLGQGAFNTSTAATLDTALRGPTDAKVLSNGKVAVVDRLNHRVLIFNQVPTANGEAAVLVLGQPDMTSSTANNGGISASSMNYPRSVYFDGTRLYVVEEGNNRILIWNSFPTTNGQPADAVFGQDDFNSNAPNKGGAIGMLTLSSPYDMDMTNDRIYIADRGNNRILVLPRNAL